MLMPFLPTLYTLPLIGLLYLLAFNIDPAAQCTAKIDELKYKTVTMVGSIYIVFSEISIPLEFHVEFEWNAG